MTVSCGVELGIPENKMASILVDIHLADGIMMNRQTLSTYEHTDSTQIYAPILKKYGYTLDDFRSSLNLYMKNPRALESVHNKVLERLKKLQDQYSSAAGIQKSLLPSKKDDLETYLRYKTSIAGDTVLIYW